MTDFVFHSPTKFVFGKGAVEKIGGELAQANFAKALIVYGGGSVVRFGTLARVKASLAAAGVAHVEFGGVRPNPEAGQVRAGIGIVRKEGCDVIVPVGGGSAIDCAKAIAFGSGYAGDIWDFFDRKAKIERSLPIAAALTLPSAGSEGSASCVVSNDALELKRGISSDLLRPAFAFLDPELTFTLPPYQTAAGVTDMIAHICERYFSGQPVVSVSDNIAAGIVRALIDAAPQALANPSDYEARAVIMWSGTLAHNDITGCGRSASPIDRAGGWESHALEHELSAHDPKITHGAGLAVMLPAWMRYVWRADPGRFLSFAKDVFGIVPSGDAPDAVETAVLSAIDRLQSFFASMGMPGALDDFGIKPSFVDILLTTLERNKGATFGAFRKLTIADARAIYQSAFRSAQVN